MLHPKDIKAKAQRLWDSGRLLRAWMGAEELFPWSLSLVPPRGGRLLEDFSAVASWKTAIEAGCKCSGGEGYRIEYLELEHRQLGRQRLPQRVVFDGPLDLAGYLGKSRDLGEFARLSRDIRRRFPSLQEWIAAQPLQVLQHARRWPQLLAVLAWFPAHPRPNLYLRELAIPGVDSKFIEGHRRLLWDLLERLLPEDAQELSVTGLARHGFERRFGLKYDQPLIRFRLLDPMPAARFGGLDDLSLPLAVFARLDPPCRRVFVTENKVNGLSFPPMADSLVIFGLGYGIEALGEVDWLEGKEIFYWGDLDTHGFAILSQLRGRFTGVRSLLMDRDTLMACRDVWGQEEPAKRFTGDPGHLSEVEAAMYRDLRDDVLGERVRLEQERIPFGRVKRVLDELKM